MTIKDTREEAINNILNGLQWLIIHHANATAREQYMPRESPDASDDYIKENKEWVGNLRRIRGEFEDLVTGLIE
jgi:hypothetical protein